MYQQSIVKKILFPFLIALSIFLLVYSYIGIIKMPADDMRDTFQKADILLYKKYLFNINRGDIVVYTVYSSEENDSTETSKYYFVQRIIGLPGDSILIDSNRVYIHNHPEKTLPSFQKNYIIKTIDSLEKNHHLDSMIKEKVMISKKFEYAVSLSDRLYWRLKKDPYVIELSYELDNPVIYEDDVFPYNESVRWNKHFFGPLYLPKPNDTIILNKKTLPIYYPLIQKEEKLCTIRNDSLFIKGKHLKQYIFKHGYYFVMGDNRDNAIDSRYLGPITKKDIRGVVFYIFKR